MGYLSHPSTLPAVSHQNLGQDFVLKWIEDEAIPQSFACGLEE